MSLTYLELINTETPRWEYTKYCVSEKCLPQTWPIVDKVLVVTDGNKCPHCNSKLIYFRKKTFKTST